MIDQHISLNGWIRTIDQLPTIVDADDAGHVYQCQETANGYVFLNDCHFVLLKMDHDRNHLKGNEFWHPKSKAPKLPSKEQGHDSKNT